MVKTEELFVSSPLVRVHRRLVSILSVFVSVSSSRMRLVTSVVLCRMFSSPSCIVVGLLKEVLVQSAWFNGKCVHCGDR